MKIFKVSFFLFLLIITAAACTDSKPSVNQEPESVDYLEKGKTVAGATFTTLSANLQKAMQDGGVQNAVQYCNLAASPLVDSLSQLHNAKIRRTALRVRNPDNKPTQKELTQLEAYQAAFEKNEKLEPILQEITPGTIAFYAPIQLMPLCEKCHGAVGEQIAEEDYGLIKKLYPDDQAINFKNGDLRGMWSIQFQK